MNHLRTGLELRGGSVQLHEGASRFFNQNMDLLTLSEKQVRKLRGGTIAYVPQDPALSLNGALRVGEQIHEVLRIHEFGRNGREREARVAEVLEEVGLPSTKKYQRRYPHQLSGGQQQRIGIAMAFACRPAVIILDEPTTGLDVATQDLVLKTVYQLTTKHDVAGLYITHDLAVVAQVANDVAVMLRGEIVERGPAEKVLYDPDHDYTKTLLAAVPDLQGERAMGGGPAVSPSAKCVRPGTTAMTTTSRSPIAVRSQIARAARTMAGTTLAVSASTTPPSRLTEHPPVPPRSRPNPRDLTRHRAVVSGRRRQPAIRPRYMTERRRRPKRNLPMNRWSPYATCGWRTDRR